MVAVIKKHSMRTRQDRVNVPPASSSSSMDDTNDSKDDSDAIDSNMKRRLGIRRIISKPKRRKNSGMMVFVMNDPDDSGDGDDERDDEDDEDEEDEEDDGDAAGGGDRRIKSRNYSKEEQAYYNRASLAIRTGIDEKESEIDLIESEERDIPLRFKVLHSGIPLENAVSVLQRIKSTSDKDKVTQFITNLTRIPFGKYSRLPIGPASDAEETAGFLNRMRSTMDEQVYGMEDVKSLFMMTIAKWVSNPTARGLVLGLRGPMGVGKTTLVKEGLGLALGIPSSFIALGSANDTSFLDGHSFTYEGSVCGQIAESLMTCGVMNPIMCFDELDKVAENSRGNEIFNTLIHLTDQTQNDRFCDKYFGCNVPFDLSRCIFVFTYNDPTFINPILRNRMIEINIPDYKMEEKRHILQKFIIPKALKDFGGSFKVCADDFTSEAISYIVDRSSSLPGMRNMQHDIAKVLGSLNLDAMLNATPHVGAIGKDHVESILKKCSDNDCRQPLPENIRHMYS